MTERITSEEFFKAWSDLGSDCELVKEVFPDHSENLTRQTISFCYKGSVYTTDRLFDKKSWKVLTLTYYRSLEE